MKKITVKKVLCKTFYKDSFFLQRDPKKLWNRKATARFKLLTV